jgi:hypothetical protein
VFKCLSLETGETVIILASRWRNRIDELRKLDRKDRLVCQGCKQPVRVRAGKSRRWHFAHKHLLNCPYESTSPTLILTRGLLYERLVELFGEAEVDIEVPVPGSDLPRQVDLWVKTSDSSCVIWLVETRLTPDFRDRLAKGLSDLGEPHFFILLDNLLNRVKDQAGTLLLTTTERFCARTTDYDLIHHPVDRPVGQTLHYLDPNGLTVTSCRDLICIHKPQVFQGRMHMDSLEVMDVDLVRGTLIHPGERNALLKILARQDHRKIKLEGSRKLFGDVLKRMLPGVQENSQGVKEFGHFQDSVKKMTMPGPGVPEKSQILMDKSAVCMFCGQETQDWWYLDRATGFCKCRLCLKKGIESKPED